MTSPVLAIERRGDVTLATLNRPTKANALSRELIAALDALAAEVLAQVSAGAGPRALVITGTGEKAFSAGADITELAGLDWRGAQQQMDLGQRVFDRLAALPIVVIAAVGGMALGGGLELAMACDIRIAAPHARFGQPEITLANLPGWGGTQRLPRLVGRGRATELILTGDIIDAERAERIGLVNHVAADPVAASMTMAERIAAMSPHAVAGAKQAIDAGLQFGMATGLAVESAAVADCCVTEEQRAAVAAFLAKKATR